MASGLGFNAVGLRIDPLDNLFFRDGRPFTPASRASGGLPQPQTLVGALRTALLTATGFDFERFTLLRRRGEDVTTALRECGAPGWVVNTRFRGPWPALVRKDDKSIEPLLPVPLTLVRDAAGKWFRSDPLQNGTLPGWVPPLAGMLPLWRTDAPTAKNPGGFLNMAGIAKFLSGDVPDDRHWFQAHELFAYDSRTGIGVNADSMTAAEGMIYAVDFLTLCPRVDRNDAYRDASVCFYAEVLQPLDTDHDFEALLRSPIPFGGEGRYATAGPVEKVRWPGGEQSSGRSLWLLATPGVFGGREGKDCWRPDRIPAERLRAAVSGNPLAVSGWDVARKGPKATRFAVPGGSVYYVEGEFTPEQESLCADPEDVAQGWGFALKGVWKNGG